VLFTDAATCATPVATAFTGIGAEIAPAAMVTLAGTCATAGASFASAMTVSASCATVMVTVRLPVAPSCSGRGFGSSDTMAAGCGETCTLELFEVPFADAVMTALPAARPVAVNTALVVPCATVTEAGTWRTNGLSTASAICVPVGCVALIVTVKLLVAPTLIVKVVGSSAVTATGGATTFTAAEAVAPLSDAVMPAWPKASAATGTRAVVCPAGTGTCAGIETIPAGLTDSGTTVSVLCTAEIVSVSAVLAPSVTVDTAGTSDTTVGGAALTVIWLDAEEPFRLAVTWALPGATAATGNGALTLPAGTITENGTDATLGALGASATEVSVVCAEEIVTVSEPLEPCVSVRVAGVRLLTAGGAGVTFTVALACPPFAAAVTMALPAASAVTGIGTLVWPEAKLTLAGTVATAVFALVTLKVPAAVGVGESVAVSVPLAPAVIASGLGASEVGLGSFGVANTVTVITVPAVPAI